jgi:heterotetrameric sarcosine oxidase gamma subunit
MPLIQKETCSVADITPKELAATLTLAGQQAAIGKSRLSVMADKEVFVVALAAHQPSGAQAALGALPKPAQALQAPLGTLLWTGPREVMLLRENLRGDAVDLATQVAAAGHVTDVSDGWVVLCFEGCDALPLLDQLLLPDLHETVFLVGAVISTVFDHMRILICRVSDARVLILSASSTAASLWHGLTEKLPQTAAFQKSDVLGGR